MRYQVELCNSSNHFTQHFKRVHPPLGNIHGLVAAAILPLSPQPGIKTKLNMQSFCRLAQSSVEVIQEYSTASSAYSIVDIKKGKPLM